MTKLIESIEIIKIKPNEMNALSSCDWSTLLSSLVTSSREIECSYLKFINKKHSNEIFNSFYQVFHSFTSVGFNERPLCSVQLLLQRCTFTSFDILQVH